MTLNPYAIRPINAAGDLPVISNVIGRNIPGPLGENAYGPIAGSTPIYILGANFTGATSVTIGGVTVGAFTVFPDGTGIDCQSPAALATGFEDVEVVTPAGTATSSNDIERFEYVDVPTIIFIGPTSIVISSGIGGGQVVTVTGTGFRFGCEVEIIDDDGVTLLQTVSANFVSDDEINFIAPTLEVKDYFIRIRNRDGQVSLNKVLPYIDPPAPTVNSLSIATGPEAGGTTTDVLGGGFYPGARVFFGLVEAVTRYTSVNVLNVTSPPSGTGPGAVNIRVVQPGGEETTLNNGFTYT